MEFGGKVAVITGAASGIGRAVATLLAQRNVGAMALVDMGEAIDDVAAQVNRLAAREVAYPYRGDVTDEAFRASVFDSISSQFGTGVAVRAGRRHHARRPRGARRQDHRQGAHLSGRPLPARRRGEPRSRRSTGRWR